VPLRSYSVDSVKHFSSSEPVLLSEVVQDVLGISYERFKQLAKLGAIYVDNYRQEKDKWILKNSVFRVHTQPRRYDCNYSWKTLVIFENEYFLVLNKPSGIPSHPSVDNVIEDALTQTSLAIKTPLFVTHRLDTLTAGLIVYGKKKQFVKDFNIQMIEHKIEKKYVALVETDRILPKILTHYMDPSPGTPKKLSEDANDGWDKCKLEILEQTRVSEAISHLKIKLLTGRTHQIRSQLSYLAAPIVGDILYGSKWPFRKNAIALRSCELAFNFEGQKMKFSLNEDFN